MATCLLKGLRLLTFLFSTFFPFFPLAMFLNQINQIICHFKGGYAYSRGYVYCFRQMFQGAAAFDQVLSKWQTSAATYDAIKRQPLANAP